MSRKTATVDFFFFEAFFNVMVNFNQRRSVVQWFFLKPACSGPIMFLDSTNQDRRLVIILSKSLPRHEVRLIGR